MQIGERSGQLTQVIIAALDEEEGIGETIGELQANLNAKILVVDGRSCDRTVEIAKDMGADVIRQDGYGKGDALAKAIKYADSNADFVVLIDADFTYPADCIQKMLEILKENQCIGMVSGNRFSGGWDQELKHDIFYVGNRLLAFTHNLLNGVTLRDPLTGLRVIRAEILRGWDVRSKSFDVEVEINHLVERKGFGIIEIPIIYRKRLGEKKLRITDGATILKRIMLETTY